MYKNYVVDTNVLIQAPYALESFEENNVILPITVLEELDSLKDRDGECGHNARQAIRFLERLRVKGSLTQGVPLGPQGMLRLETNYVAVQLPDGFSTKNDNRILCVCKGLIEKGEPTILVTKDIVLRLKAQIMNIPAEDFITDQVPEASSQYSGRADLFVPDELLSGFRKNGLSPDDIYVLAKNGVRTIPALTLNQFCILRSDTQTRKTLLGYYDGQQIVPLKHASKKPFGVTPKNVGQYFLQEALMASHSSAPLVIIKGPAGTAKTFYTLAVGLQKILNEKEPLYRKILLCRSNVQFDQDIGFLPGSEQEKIAPLLRPILDNLEILMDSDEKERYKNEKELRNKVEFLFDSGVIAAEAMNFIRGRSISHTYLMIDEAQNLTPRQIKGIITRVGKGTKLILLGDPAQIDHPLLDERTNGLSYASEHMKGSPLCFQITMRHEECERSPLALDAAQRM